MPLFQVSPPVDPLGFGFPVSADPRLTTNVAGSVQVANRGWWMRCVGGGPITAIRVPIAGTGGTGQIDVGVYANSGTGHSSIPGARKASSGVTTISTGTDTVVDVNLTSPIYVQPGDWFAISDSSAGRTYRVSGVGITGATFGNGIMGFAASVSPLPDPAPTVTFGIAGSGVFILQGV